MINQLLVVSLLLLGGWCSSKAKRLGAEMCTWGPSHWCANVGNAKSCGKEATAYCRAKVWVGNHPLAKLTKPIPESYMGSLPMTLIANPMMAKYLKPQAGGNCALCELIGKKIFDKLKTNATEEEVIEAMEEVCDILPAHYAATCRNFAEEYGAMFWEAFVEEVDVQELCVYLGLCSEQFLRIIQQGDMVRGLLARDLSSVGCDTCTALMGLVQEEATANKDELEGLLDEICAMLPVDQDECTGTVDEMFKEIMNLFESYTPKELCQMLALCNSLEDLTALLGPGPVQFGQEGQTGAAAPEVDTPLLGAGTPCQQGPEYWCASSENARQCKMEEYCKKNGDANIVF